MNNIKKLLLDKNIIFGLGLFFYFFLLLLSVLVPDLRIGNNLIVSPAFIYRSIIFTLFFIFVVILCVKKNRSINYVFGFLLLIFLITNILAIFIPIDGSSVSITSKFMALLYLISVIFTVFAFFEVLPKYLTKNTFLVFFILIDLVMVVCCLYSLIVESNDIIAAFTAKGEDAHFHQIHSFFDNKNSYGFMIFVSIIGTLFIYKWVKNKWLYVLLTFFAINLIISRAKTALILIGVLLLIYGIYKLIATFNDHKLRNILIVSFIALFVAIFMMAVFVPSIYNSSTFLSNLSNYVKEAFIGQGIRSVKARLNNLANAGSLFLAPRIIIGYGEYICREYANTCCIVLGPIDNAYIYNLLAGGIFKTILFIYCYYLIFKQAVQLTKLNNTSTIYKIFIWSLEIVLIVYGLFENFQILGSNHSSIIYLLFSYSFCKLKN